MAKIEINYGSVKIHLLSDGNKFKIDGIRSLGKRYWLSINCIYFGQDQDSIVAIAKISVFSQRKRLLIAKI